MKIGKNIRKIRELKNFTQEHMAERLGMSQNGYSKLERDETEMTLSKLMKLAEALETNFLDLIGFDENKLFFNQTSQDTSSAIMFNHNYEFTELKKQYEGRIVDLQKEIERLHALLEKSLSS